MRPPLEILFPKEIGVELIYSFVIIVCSLMIYYSTKEVYELSSYKGIKYFRQSFLFFAVAYFFRYFIQFFLVLFNMQSIIDISPGIAFSGSLFVFMYFSSMAVFYLLYSVMWKKWNHSRTKIILFNIIALAIALIGTLFRSMIVSLALNILFLLVVSFILFVAHNDSRKKHGKKNDLLVIYLLLFIFWVLSVIDILIPKFLELYRLLIYLVSISLFMAILYRVLKRVGN